MPHRYLLCFLFFGISPLACGAQSLEFVRNDGQWNGGFAYRAITGTGDAYLSKNSLTYLIGARGKRDAAR